MSVCPEGATGDEKTGVHAKYQLWGWKEGVTLAFCLLHSASLIDYFLCLKTGESDNPKLPPLSKGADALGLFFEYFSLQLF